MHLQGIDADYEFAAAACINLLAIATCFVACNTICFMTSVGDVQFRREFDVLNDRGGMPAPSADAPTRCGTHNRIADVVAAMTLALTLESFGLL